MSEPTLAPNGDARPGEPSTPPQADVDPGEGASPDLDRDGVREVWFKDSGRVIVAPFEARWTFHPDEVPVPEEVAPSGHDGEPGPDIPSTARPRPRRGALLGIVLSCAGLVLGVLVATHTGPFHRSGRAAAPSSHAGGGPWDIRGTWSTTVSFGGTSYRETLRITEESPSTGSFSGTVIAPVGIEHIRGSASMGTVSFTVTLGTATLDGRANVVRHGRQLSMIGAFSNQVGGVGTLVAALDPG